MAFATGFTIASLVLVAIKTATTAINYGVYGPPLLKFITSIPEYMGNFITAIGNFLPPYVVGPLFAMFSILVCYLLLHLFQNMINNLPS